MQHRRFQEHTTSSGLALPLLLVYGVLIVYASLYPFTGWRSQGVQAWSFVLAPWPKYWSGFDVLINVLGYLPLGFLAAVLSLQRGQVAKAPLNAALAAAALSFVMEALQTFLTPRVASNIDWLLNVFGSLLGGFFAVLLSRWGVLRAWSQRRSRWFEAGSGWALGLLLLWPLALLYPTPVPMGLGHVMERLEAALGRWLEGTQWQEWLPLREVELQPLLPLSELLVVALGILLPVMLAYSLTRQILIRFNALVLLSASALLWTTLSVALDVGPEHMWSWLRSPVQMGIFLAAILALVFLPLSMRWCWIAVLLIAVLHMALINPAPLDPYLAQSRAAWEQGRFIRFYGLTQWLSMLWPYAVLALAAARLSKIR